MNKAKKKLRRYGSLKEVPELGYSKDNLKSYYSVSKKEKIYLHIPCKMFFDEKIYGLETLQKNVYLKQETFCKTIDLVYKTIEMPECGVKVFVKSPKEFKQIYVVNGREVYLFSIEWFKTYCNQNNLDNFFKKVLDHETKWEIV